MKRTASLLSVMFICAAAFGQSSQDSLKAQLEQAEGANRDAMLVELAEVLHESEPENAIAYANEALGRLETDDERGYRVMYWKGLAHVTTGGSGLDSAWALSEQLLRDTGSSGDGLGEADAHYLAGRVHYARGELDKSLISALEAAERYENVEARQGRVAALRQAGYLLGFEFFLSEAYKSQTDHDRAISYLEEALSIAGPLDDNAVVADLYFGAGLIERARTETALRNASAPGSTDQGVLLDSDTDPHAVATGHFEQAAAIFKDLKDYPMVESVYGDIITMYYNTYDLDEVLRHANNLLTYMDAEGQPGHSNYPLFIIASVQRTRSNFEEALSTWHRILAIAEDSGNREYVSRAYGTIGFLHKQQGDFVEALSYFSRAVEIQEELGFTPWSIVEIAEIYFEQGDFPEALAMYERALIDAEAYITNTEDYTPETHGRVTAYPLIGIANVYRMQGNYDDALDFFTRALDVMSVGLDQDAYTRVLKSMGQIHSELGNHADALSYLDQAMTIMEYVGDRSGRAETLLAISAVYRQQGRSDEALTFADSSLALADSVGALQLVRDAHLERSLGLEQQDRFAEALSAHRAYKTANDSLFTSEGQGVVAELQQQYKTKEQQQQIALLESSAQIQRLWRIGLFGALLLIASIAFLLFNRYRLKDQAHTALTKAHSQLKTTQQQLIQQEKMASLGQLTAGIAHEIKNPLNFVNNFAGLNVELLSDLREALQEDDKEETEFLLSSLIQNTGKIEQHGKRADGIVHAMIQHSAIGSGQRELTDVNRLVREHVDLVLNSKRAHAPEFQFAVEHVFSDDTGEIVLNPQEIGRVLINLLGNAVDAIHERASAGDDAYAPQLVVFTNRTDSGIDIKVSDNGPGIPTQNQEKIFEPFFTTKPTGEGTGLGLSMSYDVVTQGHGGTLSVESNEGMGATFTISLPVAD